MEQMGFLVIGLFFGVCFVVFTLGCVTVPRLSRFERGYMAFFALCAFIGLAALICAYQPPLPPL